MSTKKRKKKGKILFQRNKYFVSMAIFVSYMIFYDNWRCQLSLYLTCIVAVLLTKTFCSFTIVFIPYKISFLTGFIPIPQAFFGLGTARILVFNFDCAGNEEDLLACSTPSDSICRHVEDVGVRCGSMYSYCWCCTENTDIRSYIHLERS